MTKAKNEQKKTPDFHIYLEGPEGTRYAGAAYKHQKGTGFGINIGGQRYVAFAPKIKSKFMKEEGA